MQDEKSPVRSDGYFPEWKPAFNDISWLPPFLYPYQLASLEFIYITYGILLETYDNYCTLCIMLYQVCKTKSW